MLACQYRVFSGRLIHMAKTVKRLFDQFSPEKYNLELNLDPEEMSFSGKITILGKKAGRPSQRLTFHQKGLSITQASLSKHSKAGPEEYAIDRINNHSSYDEVRLHSTKMLYPGKYTVHIEFKGKITKQMTGLYPCFFNKDGKEKKLLATQFESHHAREVFPCIDEPEAKAVFELTLITPKSDVVLSNTPIKKQVALVKNNLKTVFEETPIMSTYLLAFVTGDMHCVEAKTKNGTIMRSWSTSAQPKGFLEYANKEAVDLLEFYEEYFDTPFPLPKCDQVALPDFESGAMENWGLITYREVALLADPINRSIASEQYVSMVVAHELSHQWFGNLVTMKWWDDLWLNESFASLMEHVSLNVLHPDWHQWEQYTSADVIACSNRDIYKDVQPVKVDVRHPDEIGSLFDPAIVYAKGGRLLKMMLDYIGEEAFRKGLKSYFVKHAYKNTIRDDLWTEMSAVSGKDINSLMDPWLEQSGMPVVRLEGSGKQRQLTQERFVLDSKKDKQIWPIPLLADRVLSTDILSEVSVSIETDNTIPLLNSSGSGHFLVHYASDDDLAKLIERIKSGDVSAEARINILNDLLLLSRRGDDSIVDALKLISELRTEPRDAVWAIMARGLGLAYNLGEDDKHIEDGIKKLKHKLAHKNYEKLGWDDNDSEDPNTKMLRATSIGFMLGAEDKDTIDQAIKIYESAKNIEDIPSDRRGLVLGTVVRHGNKLKDIDRLIKEYKTNQNQDLQQSIAAALTHTKDPEVINRLIEEALGKDGFVRDQDVFRWFAYLMRSKYSRRAAWEWLTSSWTRIEKDFGESKSLDYFVVYASAPLQTDQWETDFRKFFEPKRDMVALQRKIDIALAEIKARVEWRNRELPKLKQYFTE
jgi:aminopeptidase N